MTATNPPISDDILYPASDGLGIADYHQALDAIIDTYAALRAWGQHRIPAVYAGAAKLLYYREDDPHARISCDIIAAVAPDDAIPARDRWLIWEEGAAPDLIIEIDQPRNNRPDWPTRQSLYRELGVKECLRYNPRASAQSPPVQIVIPVAAGIKETGDSITTWHSTALDCYLHFLRGCPGAFVTDAPTPPGDIALYRKARQNIHAELQAQRREIAERYQQAGMTQQWLNSIDRAIGRITNLERQPQRRR